MKRIFKPMILMCIFMTVMMSCNKEELVEEKPITEAVDDTINEEEVTDEISDEDAEVDTSLPCDFDLNDVAAGETVIINCVMDLEGTTVNLPSDVTVLYEGGAIINGTINFSENTTIDGNLLNITLVTTGSIPILKDPAFVFDPEQWGIVEGEVSDKIATENREIINEVIAMADEMGASTFVIDEMDAYFEVSTEEGSPRHDKEASIFIPSNFHLKMGENCNLRVQPTHVKRYVLIYSRSTENITISGGKLWGDRYAHDYKTLSGVHDWGHIMMLRGVHNSVVDGVEMHEGMAEGLQIGGTSHRYNDGTLKPDGRESKNITVKNCLINDNRRNNISVVDGTDIYIEYNTIRNAGSGDDSPEVSSNGTSPRAGIDIEGFKNNAPDDNSVYNYEKTENIHIRNNIFEDNYAVDVALYNGENTYVYKNTFRSERGISAAYSFNNKIYDNTFERPEGLMSGSHAVKLEPRYWANGTHRITDFEIYNNTFTGYQFAIVAGGQGHTFSDNTIIDCKRGIILIDSEDLVFDNNVISSSIDSSYGYYTFSGETSIKNCLIKNGESKVQSRDLMFADVNNDETGDVIVDNVVLNGGGVFLNSAKNITIKNSTFGDLKLVDSSPILSNNN